MLSSLLKGPIEVVLVVKNMPANAGDLSHAGSIPRSGELRSHKLNCSAKKR